LIAIVLGSTSLSLDGDYFKFTGFNLTWLTSTAALALKLTVLTQVTDQASRSVQREMSIDLSENAQSLV
jgi:hypothetical protein